MSRDISDSERLHTIIGLLREIRDRLPNLDTETYDDKVRKNAVASFDTIDQAEAWIDDRIDSSLYTVSYSSRSNSYYVARKQ